MLCLLLNTRWLMIEWRLYYLLVHWWLHSLLFLNDCVLCGWAWWFLWVEILWIILFLSWYIVAWSLAWIWHEIVNLWYSCLRHSTSASNTWCGIGTSCRWLIIWWVHTSLCLEIASLYFYAFIFAHVWWMLLFLNFLFNWIWKSSQIVNSFCCSWNSLFLTISLHWLIRLAFYCTVVCHRIL
jgi:hypothetical protein